MIVLNKSNLNSSTCTERYIKSHYPEWYQYLIEKYPDISWSEKLYWYYNNITEHVLCPVCGNPTKFNNINTGYRTYCSAKCANSSQTKKDQTKQTCIHKYGGLGNASAELRKKYIQTSIERHGVDNISKLQETRDHTKQTCIELYGGQGNASAELRKKYIQTNIERYGVDNIMKSDEGKSKIQSTLLAKYGVTHQSKISSVIEKARNTRKNNTLTRYDDVISWDGNNWLCSCPHPECNKCKERTYIVPPSIYRDRKRDHTEPCTKLLKVSNITTSGTSIELFVRNILDEYNIPYETNVRNIISPKELDIYIPSKNIAIECNGIQSHCTNAVGQIYHYNKYANCARQDIQLLAIWHDWIINKPDIVKSIILSKLGIYNTRIYARQCQIREISTQECNNLLNMNHIQGGSASNIRYGLIYNNEIVSVMSFQRRSYNQWELVRYCTTLNTQVIGGAAKLLNHFIKEHQPEYIYSFSSNDISNGNLYKKLGFEKTIINKSYWYIDIKTMTRYHRSSFTKRAIINKGWKSSKEGWTESEVMQEHGYYQIYDSGQTKWVLNTKESDDC